MRPKSNPLRRQRLYEEATRIVVRDAPWAFVFSNLAIELAAHVKNRSPHPPWPPFYRDVWLDEPESLRPFSNGGPHPRAVLRWATGRLVPSLFVLWAVASLVFVCVHAIGDPALAILGPRARPEQIEAFRRRHVWICPWRNSACAS
ncbi:MAG: hypothetical protein NZM37_12535 [Sandaracinaceae bacterium]|nr:hypothetical protein [Sandaracinaceae bacterium]